MALIYRTQAHSITILAFSSERFLSVSNALFCVNHFEKTTACECIRKGKTFCPTYTKNRYGCKEKIFFLFWTKKILKD